MAVEVLDLRDLGGRDAGGVRHEADRSVGAVFAREIERMTPAAIAEAKADIAGGHMDKDSFSFRIADVLEGRRIYEELPVVFMSGEIERNFFRTLVRKRSARQKHGSAKREL